MSSSEDPIRTWWIFYPLKGLEIIDVRHDLLQPIFGDIALISKKHIRQIVPLLRLNQRLSPGHDHERDIVYMLENITFKEEFDSYIAVRRTGSTSKDEFEPQVIKDARGRLYQVAALLSLVFMSLN